MGRGAYPELIQKCIDSWHRFLPDYEIRLWNEDTFDTSSVLWVQQAMEQRKFAFAADYIRFYALYHHGGIYLDTDVETLKSFDELLHRREFLCEEANGDVESGIMGTEKGAQWVRECMEYYETHPFVRSDGSLDMRSVPLLIDDVMLNHRDIEILPMDYFSPKDFNTGRTHVTANTFCIHHYSCSWINKGMMFKVKIMAHRLLYVLFGHKGHNAIVRKIRQRRGQLK